MIFDYTITWDSAALDNGAGSETLLHFRAAPAGVNGGIEVGVGVANNPATGSATLDQDQADDLLGDGWYANLHTSAFSGGEIRGQLLATPVPEPSVALLAMLALVPVLKRSRR